VKRWQIIVFAVPLIAAGAYVYLHRQELGAAGLFTSRTASSDASGEPVTPAAQPARINWQTVDRPQDGFKLEMPSDTKELQLPAYSENGGTKPISMIYANPDSATTFSITWGDNPPVVEASNRTIDRIMDMARDGALERSQTTLMSESRSAPGGNPARDFIARNAGGGVMDTRLVMVGKRLYMLSAAFPSMSARREQDVTRFFNSFRAGEATAIPGTVPPAGQN
jgi:hypothetical protein